MADNQLSPGPPSSPPFRPAQAVHLPYRPGYQSPGPEASQDELRRRLREALRMLREKEDDLRMAAELGASLVEDNERLKAECTRLLAAEHEQLAARSTAPPNLDQQRPPPQHDHAHDNAPHDDHPDTPNERAYDTSHEDETSHAVRRPDDVSIAYASPTQTIHSHSAEAARRRAAAAALEASAAASRIANLESTLVDAQTQIERARAEARAAQDSDRASERRALRLETELDVATRDLDAAVARCAELEEDKKRLVKEKADLARKVPADGERDRQLEEMAELKDRARALEDVVVQLTHARAEMEAEIAGAAEDRERALTRCEELEVMIEEFRGESESQMARNDDLQWEVETARDAAAKLEARLAVLEPRKRDGAEDVGDRTLFSEVEDRRQALETKHVSLAQKHAGLMKAHSMSINQQERMRSHISRLTQLTSHREGETRIRLLEEALGQSESERQELQHTIMMLEKERAEFDADDDIVIGGNTSGSAKGQPQASRADFEVELECLRSRVAQLAAEQDESKAEVRTLRMLKSFETEKLRSVESLLREREDDLQRMKAVNAQLKFDLDQAKDRIRQQRAQLRQQSDEGNLSVLSDSPADSLPTTKDAAVQTVQVVKLPSELDAAESKLPGTRDAGPDDPSDKENSLCSSTLAHASETSLAVDLPQPTRRSHSLERRPLQIVDSANSTAPPAPLPASKEKPTHRSALAVGVRKPQLGKGGPSHVFVDRKQAQTGECNQQ
ncbi:hypothetical protein HDU87_006150 [Geranomyces variabilis]|uniref:Uncharacterized protein n=1 Tax=Geranomyces variabilis TaxID=109894 RepID=A0AAD5TFY7_9FUNG|nr:hypothetical protein HDU87_006150 [Geranomyces variabilis]